MIFASCDVRLLGNGDQNSAEGHRCLDCNPTDHGIVNYGHEEV